eukprot:TRINITY_DN111078_c0_g1_i1.p2 TRINITY_DN111078_c0_g1~~TRINITY_DN111078_c0_g1_i1.p2  ORF type:complete len:144 (-),score=39.21 TRINITY_DN111078_c0_g1_i1:41-472(-)
MMSANEDHEIAVMQQLAMAQVYAEQMVKVFEETDKDRSGEITFDELEAQLESPEMMVLFESLGLQANDAWALFALLDYDKSGSINSEEFVTACCGARGNAKAIHVNSIIAEQKVVKRHIRELHDKVVELSDSILFVVGSKIGF